MFFCCSDWLTVPEEEPAFWGLSQTCRTSGLRNIIFVILMCFHLTNLFGDEKFNWLPSKWLMKFCIFRGTQIFLSNHNFQFFSSANLFLEGSALNFSYPKNYQMKAGQKNPNMILQTLGLVQVCLCQYCAQ